jgi:hypothetical protein
LIFNKLILLIGEIVIILFIHFILDIAWYRCYWLTILLHMYYIIPYMIYYNQFTSIDGNYKNLITPLTFESLPKYLFILLLDFTQSKNLRSYQNLSS